MSGESILQVGSFELAETVYGLEQRAAPDPHGGIPGVAVTFRPVRLDVLTEVATTLEFQEVFHAIVKDAMRNIDLYRPVNLRMLEEIRDQMKHVLRDLVAAGHIVRRPGDNRWHYIPRTP